VRIPPSAAPDVQQSLREVWQAIDTLLLQHGLNIDLQGRRVINAGDGVQPTDYVTKEQLDRAAGPAATKNAVFDSLVVRVLARILGTLYLPQFSDGSKHHAILFVDATGAVAVQEDGAFALDLNLTDGLLELGYGLILRWFNQAGIGSAAVDVVNVTDHLGASNLLRFVIGLDDATGISLTKNGSTLEIRVAGAGGALTDLTIRNLSAANVTPTGGNAAFATVVVGTDPGGVDPLRVGGGVTLQGGVTTHDGIVLHAASPLTDGVGASGGTLGNAPHAGDPDKWLEIIDNGVTRKFPTWT
jgi:hypothetical protein